MRKKIPAFLLLAAMLLSLSACTAKEIEPSSVVDFESLPPETETEPPAPETFVLIGGADAPADSAAGRFAACFGERVEALSGGLVTVMFQPDAILGNERELQQLVLDGELDFTVCQTAETSVFVPEAALFDLPMLFTGKHPQVIGDALNEGAFADALREAYQRAGFDLLGIAQAGTYRLLISDKEITSRADLKDLILAIPENENSRAFWEGLGAKIGYYTHDRVYRAVEDEMIRACETSADIAAADRLYEVMEYIVPTAHALECWQLLFSADNLSKLPEEYQGWVRQAAQEAAAQVSEEIPGLREQAMAVLTENGMDVCELPEDFREGVLDRDAVAELYETIGTYVGGDLLDQLREALAAEPPVEETAEEETEEAGEDSEEDAGEEDEDEED